MRPFTLRTAMWLPVALAAGCLGPVAQDDGLFRHRDHGYVVAAPGAASTPWQRIDLAGATLAFRGGQTETMMIKSRCGRPVAGAQLMARHLLIGLPERKIIEAHPVQVAGVSGWLYVVDTVNDAEPVRLKAVTLVARGCSFDLVLAASRARFEAVEPVFDEWMAGFRFLAPEPAA